jgi:hypothetical protein
VSGGAASTPSPGLIAPDALTRCAGVTVEKAAIILGASPAELTDYSEPQKSGGHLCAYVNQKDRSKAVTFTLSRRDSLEQAAASMRRERESMVMAQGSIDRATGSKSKEKAIQDVSGIGDEAFYSPLNDAILLRVTNVIVQVTAPEDMALKKRAAEEVARGLRPEPRELAVADRDARHGACCGAASTPVRYPDSRLDGCDGFTPCRHR